MPSTLPRPPKPRGSRIGPAWVHPHPPYRLPVTSRHEQEYGDEPGRTRRGMAGSYGPSEVAMVIPSGLGSRCCSVCALCSASRSVFASVDFAGSFLSKRTLRKSRNMSFPLFLSQGLPPDMYIFPSRPPSGYFPPRSIKHCDCGVFITPRRRLLRPFASPPSKVPALGVYTSYALVRE